MTNKRTEPFVAVEGAMCRLDNRPARVKRLRLNGLCDVWTDYGLRTVMTWQLAAPKPGDVLLPTPAEYRVRRAGTR